jgi:phosphonate transport system substrate-binding protein
LSASSAGADIKLTFGTYTADKPTDTVRKIKPVLKYLESSLSRQLGEPVRISTQIAKDYDKGISQLINGKVDFARFGPASYVLAKGKAAQISILAMEAVKGQKMFHGIICVQENSDIQQISDLSGKTFAFGNKLSTIGRYLAQSQLLDAGINGDHLKRYEYLGRHDRVGTAVGNNEFDAGALKLSTFKKLRKKNVAIRELHRFENVTKPWIARAGLDEKVAAALKNALLGLSDAKVLKAIKKSGFLPGHDGEFKAIREAMKRSEQFSG